MISETLMSERPYIYRRDYASGITNSVVAGRYDSVQSSGMIDTEELLRRLDDRNIKNVQIARALGLPDSRIPEIRSRKRAIKLDEAAKLVRAFELEEAREVPPVPLPIMRLAVRYVALQLRANPPEETIEECAKVLRAFSAFLSDRRVRQSVDAAEGFFRALSLRLPESDEEARQQTDPHHAH